ncbi:hypothetical protein Syn9311C4_38 [Synechococcus phage ACG-2014b]|uniref:Uncharacterized protein n=1 Tax=Synechococcus phage ACG-2014b TaxID=1493508 RepID=A0A0E3HUD2_9CAUD|nr:hypothetical protein HOQ68_gp038 [Synechococcus phage ACG-2014b]AIX39121.1 hypothetical protein Syn9311C4_38 [Synechococcus phage ACG-2014b]
MDIKELQEIPKDLLLNYVEDRKVSSNLISEEQKEGIISASRFLEENGHHDLAVKLLNKYNARTISEYNLHDSEFINYLEQANIGINVQGYVTVGAGEDAIKYPIVIISADVMRLEMMYQKLKYELQNDKTSN